MKESILPTIAIKGDWNSFKMGINLTNSSVFPLLEINIVGSPGLYMPKSPWMASAACI